LVSDAPLVAGVELGGTKCVCLLAGGPDDIRDEIRLPTRGPDETLAAIDGVLARWHGEHGFGALGIASFGPLDLDPRSAAFGTIVGTPKRAWERVALLPRVRAFKVPVGVDTDVNGAAQAEGLWGGARGLDSWSYVTLGTGLGVGSIVGGMPVRGLGHAEAGHQRVPRLPGERWPGSCPFHGDCAEGLASGPAIQARAGLPFTELGADHPVWNEVVHALTALFHNLILTVVPERILVGGGVVLGQPSLLPRIRRAVQTSLGDYGHFARSTRNMEEYLRTPVLGERAGPLGAIALAHQALNSRQMPPPPDRARP
jgi:fructokinase